MDKNPSRVVPGEESSKRQLVRAEETYDAPKEIDLVELFFVLLSHWKGLVIGTLVGAVLAMGYHFMMVVPAYRATTEIYITTTDSLISLQDLQIGSQVADDYRTIIISRPVMNQVIKDLSLDMSYRDLQKLVTVTNPTGTHIIRTMVTTNDVAMSRDIANDLLEVSIDQIHEIIGTSQPSIIDYSAAEAIEDVSPSLIRFAAIGGLIGFLCIAGFVTIMMLVDSTVKNEADVERYFHKPVLSTIPYYEEGKDTL